MPALRKRLTRWVAAMEQSYDDLAFNLKKRLKLNDSLQIVTYRSYGTTNHLYIKGRILEGKAIRKSTAQDTVWHNILSMYRRFESDEVRGAHVKITVQEKEYFAISDHEGYFTINIQTDTPLAPNDAWHEIAVTLLEAPMPFISPVNATAEILIPPISATYGIISDIDDTIVKTTATSLLAMARNTFFHNAHTRLPFAGVSAFYKALQTGHDGKRNNPFFYVSSSPWNLYDLLVDFLDLNDIPQGPLLLRDFGLEKDKTRTADHMGHKFKEIENILKTYPHLNFVLIGDSGQEDPRIYREVVRQYPNRIITVYIRDVQLPDREKIAIDISKDQQTDKIEMIIADNTAEAAEHAVKIGLIPQHTLAEIIDDKKRDKGQKPGKETLQAIPPR